MTLTFLHLNPLSRFFPNGGHWDLASSGAVARCVLETYLRLVYFATEQVSEQRHFRSILSQYHAQFQAVEINTYSHAPKEILAQHQSLCDQARSALEANPYFQNLPLDWRKHLIDNPSRIDLPKVSKAAGISPGYHHSSYEFCSAFVHGSLYAVEFTEFVNLQTGEGLNLFKELANTVAGHVALGIHDFASLFPKMDPLEPRTVRLITFWQSAMKWEELPDFERSRRIAHGLESGEQISDTK